MTLSLEQKIAKKENELNRLKKQKEKEKTRQKIIAGAVMIESALDNPPLAQTLIDLINEHVTRKSDLSSVKPLLEQLQESIDEHLKG